MSRPILPNRTARRLFLHHHHLCGRLGTGSAKDNVRDLIQRLGFVQFDSISTVERAHHMILSARRKPYRPKHLKTLLERDRALFEHWTHDASVIPVEFYPYWRLKFERDAQRLPAQWRDWQGRDFTREIDEVQNRIARDGACLAREVGQGEEAGEGMMMWRPSKVALEYLWRSGRLAIAGRNGIQKIFDLTERVIPAQHLAPCPDEDQIIDWACRSALDRLGFATSGELAAFWALISPAQAKAWCAAQPPDDLIEIDIQDHTGKLRPAFARPGLLDLPEPDLPDRVRILSPFDPALRDRKRAERLFGFDYRIEIFVPAPKRRYGYYVFPVLHRDQVIGRIDMKRQDGALAVTAFWPEPGVRLGQGRMARLEAELARVAGFAGCGAVDFAADWLRAPMGA